VRRSQAAGFTLVELLITMAMIAILAGVAVSYTGESRANLRAFSEDLVGEADAARMRAVSSRRWNRLRFDADLRKVVVDQAIELGMAVPDDDGWQQVSTLAWPKSVKLVSITTTSDVDDGNEPVEDDGVDETITFAPDGAAVSRTIYLQSDDLRVMNRIVIYRATGTAYAKVGW
jgi:prepilin-type N-terminal cleavage/methylation domain-containing protein